MSKNELINQLQLERSRIEGMIAELTEEQMDIPSVQGEWTVKDIIAHLTVWERRGTQWIEWAKAVAQGMAALTPQAGYSARDMDRLNQESYRQNKDRPLQEILEEFKQSLPPLLEQIQTLREEDLERIVQSDWTDGKPATIREIILWRYWHYRDHGKAIEAWMKKIKTRC